MKEFCDPDPFILRACLGSWSPLLDTLLADREREQVSQIGVLYEPGLEVVNRPLSFQWSEFDHMITPSCKGSWEKPSSHVPWRKIKWS